MLSTEVQRALKEKSGEIVSLREAWSQAVSQAMQSGMDEASIVAVVQTLNSPTSLRKLSESVGKRGRGPQDRFLDLVAKYSLESDYSVDEWLCALERILLYLTKHNRSSPIDTLLGYLSCSAEYLNTTGSNLAFAESIEAFLEEFGFDG